jgi:AGZA family xanthine/uracil permease-like MFS transporter
VGERIPFSQELIPAFLRTDTWIHGAFALEQGFIFTAMLWAAATVEIIERRFRRAALWFLAGALLSACGLMHRYQWTFGDTAIELSPAWPWASGYAALALLLFLAPVLTEPGESH